MYNRIILIGNLTRDIELRYLPSSAAIAKGAIASTHKFKKQDGTTEEEVCFLDFTCFGGQASICSKYLKKGSKVLLEGRLVFEQWTTQDGSSRSRHSLRVETMKMLDSKPSEGQSSYQAPTQPKQEPQIVYEQTIPEIDIDPDEISF